jgi:hypothetical protein
MPNVVLKDNHLTFGGKAYFRCNADDVYAPGCIGEKRTPWLKENYLEVKDLIPVNKIDVIRSSVIGLDTSNLSTGDVGANIKAIVPVGGVPVPATLGVDDAFKKLKSSEIKLVKFSVMNNDMMKAANNSPDKIQSLINWGDDARIAIEVFVAMDATLATKFANDASVTLSAGVDKVVKATVGAGGSGSGGTTVQMTNMGFAYLLAKIDWDAHEKKNQTRIVDLDDDQWSLS